MVLALAALFVAEVQSGRSVGGGRSLAEPCKNTYYCNDFFGNTFASKASKDIEAAAVGCRSTYYFA